MITYKSSYGFISTYFFTKKHLIFGEIPTEVSGAPE